MSWPSDVIIIFSLPEFSKLFRTIGHDVTPLRFVCTAHVFIQNSCLHFQCGIPCVMGCMMLPVMRWGLFCDLSMCVFVFRHSSWTRQWTQSAVLRILSHRWASMALWRCQRSPLARHYHSANTSAPSVVTGPQVSMGSNQKLPIYYSVLCFFYHNFYFFENQAQLAQISLDLFCWKWVLQHFLSLSLAKDLWDFQSLILVIVVGKGTNNNF